MSGRRLGKLWQFYRKSSMNVNEYLFINILIHSTMKNITSLCSALVFHSKSMILRVDVHLLTFWLQKTSLCCAQVQFFILKMNQIDRSPHSGTKNWPVMLSWKGRVHDFITLFQVFFCASFSRIYKPMISCWEIETCDFRYNFPLRNGKLQFPIEIYKSMISRHWDIETHDFPLRYRNPWFPRHCGVSTDCNFFRIYRPLLVCLLRNVSSHCLPLDWVTGGTQTQFPTDFLDHSSRSLQARVYVSGKQ